MPNNYFSFKQFTIQQDKCAMKVCTDSCLFGTIISHYLPNKKEVLDIGSGTGLLSLMYAQKNAATIDAIELNENAYIQSKENIASVPFANINVIHENIGSFATTKKYDLIISNPPFFKNSLKSNIEERNTAMHNDELSYSLLVAKVVEMLDSKGFFAVLIPHYAKEEFINIATASNLFVNTIFNIKQTISHSFFRTVLFFSFHESKIETMELFIKDDASQYSKEFGELLKDYYLFL